MIQHVPTLVIVTIILHKSIIQIILSLDPVLHIL